MLRMHKAPMTPRPVSPPLGLVSPEVRKEVELDALRQRGLAKLLNKHFTEVTKELAAEKAAAEAALKDLEARKAAAAAKRTEPASPNRGLSSLDQLHVSVNQWNVECRRKEKETLLLYQRYVDRFGATGKVKVPTPMDQSSPAPLATTPLRSPAPRAVPPSTGSPDSPDTSLNELEDFLQQAGLSSMPCVEKEHEEIRKYYRRRIEQEMGELSSPDWKRSSDTPELEEATGARGSSPVLIRSLLEPIIHEDREHNDDAEFGSLYVPPSSDDTDADSLVSGLTMNSAETRRVLLDCEKSVATFLKEEKQAIQKLMSEETDGSTSVHSAPSLIGSATQQAADQAETMVKQMQQILGNFEKSGQVNAAKPEGRPYNTNNPNEKWVVYYDESFKREYYHEINTDRTQWEAPDLDGTASTRSSSVLSHDDVRPEQAENSVSRVTLYRRRLKRQRKRRLMALAILTVVSVIGGGYYMYRQSQLQLEQQHHLEQERALQAAALAEQKAEEERSRKEAEEKKRVEAERASREAERTIREAEKARIEEERVANLAAEHARRVEAERLLQEERAARMQRPVGCNIPLSYLVHGHCYRLASENPIFDAQELTDAMMQ